MIRSHIWLQLHTIVFYLRHRDLAQFSVAIVFLIILGLIFVLSFIFGRLFMEFISGYEQLSPILLRFVLLTLLTSLSILSLMSFVIVFSKTLFDGKLLFFFSLPIPVEKIAFSVFLTTLLVGSWPYLLISLPFFFGIAWIANPNLWSILQIFILHFLMSIILASLGGVIALIIKTFFGRRLANFLPIILLLTLASLFLLFTKIIYPANLSDVALHKSLLELESFLNSSFVAKPYLPTTLFVNSFLGETLSLFVLIFQTGISIIAFLFFSRLVYKKNWQENFEGFLLAGGERFEKSGKMLSKQTSFFGKTAKSVVLEKELIYFRRTTNAYIYLSFVIFLSAIFIFYLSKADIIDGGLTKLIPAVTISVLFATSYLLLLFAIRFIFPTFTLEAPFLWLTITSEKIRSRFHALKWIFYLSSSIFFSTVLALLVIKFVEIPIGKPGNILLLLLGNSLTTSAFALLLGELFQKELPRGDVEAISTTIPGILVTVISLVSGAFFSVVILSANVSFIALILLVVSIVFVFWGYQFSYHNYQKSDI